MTDGHSEIDEEPLPSEEDYDDEYEDYEDYEDADEERRRRTRTILAIALALLALLLIGLVVGVIRLVTPAGSGQVTKDLPPGIEWVRSIYGYGPAETDQFYRPVDAAVSPDGTLWGVDGQRSRILGFNPDGTFNSLLHTGPRASGPGRLGLPEGIATDEQGNVYVVDGTNNKVMVFSPDNRVIREIPVPYPLEVAVRGGRVVVTSQPGVSVFDTSGKLLSVIGKQGQGPNEFLTPHGVAIGADGTIYVSDTNNERIKAYKQDGTLLWIWPANRRFARKPGTNPGSSTGPLRLPTGMTIDGQGRLVLTDSFNFDLVVLRPGATGATLVARYGEAGPQDGFFAYPTGIDYDAARDYFVVADTSNDRLQVVRIPGSAAPGIAAAARRFFAGPWAWCCFPLILLLIALALALWRRAARRKAEEAQAQEGDASDALAESDEAPGPEVATTSDEAPGPEVAATLGEDSEDADE